MRRLLIAPLIVAALVLALGLALAGCGTAAQNASLGGDTSPAGILAASMDASTAVTSAKAEFDLSLSFDVDKSQMPAEQLAYLDQPMQISGQLAFAAEPLALDLALDASLAGQALNVGLKMAEGKAYIGLAGQWYEAPAEMMQMFGGAGSQTATSEQMQNMLTDLGIDPAAWMKEVRLVGEESLDGVDVYHLEATPDLTAMINDVFGLMQSGQFAGMMGQTGATGGTDGTGATLPAMDGLDEIQQQLPEMFRNLKAEIWVAKDSLLPLKTTVGAQIVPPAGEDSGGVNAINFSMTVALSDINEPVSVDAPVSAQPWDEFLKALEANPAMLGPLGGLGAGSLGGTDFSQ